jgi:hypothetical protein
MLPKLYQVCGIAHICSRDIELIPSFPRKVFEYICHAQIVQMATFFGMKGGELRKVKIMSSFEENARSQM